MNLWADLDVGYESWCGVCSCPSGDVATAHGVEITVGSHCEGVILSAPEGEAALRKIAALQCFVWPEENLVRWKQLNTAHKVST